MATGPFNFGASFLIFDLKTLKVIYSYTGQGMLGVKGQSILFTCQVSNPPAEPLVAAAKKIGR